MVQAWPEQAGQVWETAERNPETRCYWPLFQLVCSTFCCGLRRLYHIHHVRNASNQIVLSVCGEPCQWCDGQVSLHVLRMQANWRSAVAMRRCSEYSKHNNINTTNIVNIISTQFSSAFLDSMVQSSQSQFPSPKYFGHPLFFGQTDFSIWLAAPNVSYSTYNFCGDATMQNGQIF